MNLPTIVDNLYTNPHSEWILDLEDSMILPYVIQIWLVMNDRLRVQVRWLDKYVFSLPPKMYLSLAWSVIPKTNKRPWVKYIKTATQSQDFDFIFTKFRKEFEMSDNDFNAVRGRLVEYIRNNMNAWFSYYGVEKKFWNKFNLKFDTIKDFNKSKELGIFDFDNGI